MTNLRIIAFVILSALFVSCGSSPIVGKWKYTKGNAVMEYTADGKVKTFDEAGKETGPELEYTTDGPGKITVNDGNINPKCIYKIEGSKMTMTCSSGPGQDYPKGFSDTNPVQVTFERK